MGVQLAWSHSWLNYLEVEAKKAVGYIRNYMGKDDNVDIHNAYVMHSPETPVCKATQQAAINLKSWPRLKAAPGDKVVAYHYENGHVSTPETAGNSGRTYWFGTTKQDAKHTLGDVLKWIDDGEEQGGPGRYLAASLYDDQKCAEANPSPISAERGIGPGGVNKPCKDIGFVVPAELKPGSVYTVYWVWDYSQHWRPKPDVFEYYSSCLDIDIIAGSESSTGSESPTGTRPPRSSESPVGAASPRSSESPTGTRSPRSSESPTGAASPRSSESPTGAASPRSSESPTGTESPRSSGSSTGTESPRSSGSPTGTRSPTSTRSPTATRSPTGSRSSRTDEPEPASPTNEFEAPSRVLGYSPAEAF